MASERRRSHTEPVDSGLTASSTDADAGTVTADDGLQARLAAAVHSIMDPLSILTSVRNSAGAIIDFEWTYINEAGARSLRLPVPGIMHRLLLDVLPGHVGELFDSYRKVVETGDSFASHEVSYHGRWGREPTSTRTLNIRAAKVGDGVTVSWRDVTEHVEARERLALANDTVRLHQQIVEGATEGIWVIDEHNRTTYVNQAMADLLGVTPSEMIGTDLYTFTDEVSSGDANERVRSLVEGRGETFNFRLMNRRGEDVWTRMTTAPLGSPNGTYLGGFALVTDITEEVRNNRQREIVESMFAQATEQAPIGQAIVGLDGTFLSVNSAFCAMTGFAKEQLLGMTFQEITHPDDLDADVEQAIALAVGDISSYTMDKRYIRADGLTIWVKLHGSVVRDDDNQPVHYVAQVLDIDKQRKAEESAAHAIRRLAYRSTHDPLTTLPNRSKFLATLSRAMHLDEDDSIAVLFIDIDQFKHVNDGISHSSGDAALVEVARRIRGCVREDDVVGRLGGDEFAVIAQEVDSIGDAMLLAERVRRAISERPFNAGGNRVHITVSIGVARTSAGASPQEILSRADAALHLAKARGRNCSQLADREMLKLTRDRLQLVDRLHDGITMDEFYPWFQKIVDLQTGELVGHELLVRWIRGSEVLEAEHFIDAAEDSGLINSIGRKVISNAIDIFAEQNPSEFLAINASPVQLRVPGFAQSILSQLADAGISAERLSLEITEQSLLGNETTIIDNLAEFHKNNIDLYVDDFGTGFSSISTLRDYPIAGLKLDKSFSGLLATNPNGSIAQLVCGLSELAAHLGLDRIAEGIEDQQCADRVLELGWVRGQGFLFGHAESLSPQRLRQAGSSGQARPAGKSGKQRACVPEPRPGRGGAATPEPADASGDGSRKNRRAGDRSTAKAEPR